VGDSMFKTLTKFGKKLSSANKEIENEELSKKDGMFAASPII